jgi:hypothetical protein
MRPPDIPQGKRGFTNLERAAVLAAIFVFTYVIHALSPVTTSTDSAWTFHVAASILREHNFNLDEYRNVINLQLTIACASSGAISTHTIRLERRCCWRRSSGS